LLQLRIVSCVTFSFSVQVDNDSIFRRHIMASNLHIYHQKEHFTFIPASMRKEVKLVLAASFGSACLILFLLLATHT